MYSVTMMVPQAIPDPIHFVAPEFPHAAEKVVANCTVLTTKQCLLRRLDEDFPIFGV